MLYPNYCFIGPLQNWEEEDEPEVNDKMFKISIIEIIGANMRFGGGVHLAYLFLLPLYK